MKRKFYFYAQFTNGDKAVDYYDEVTYADAITSGFRDIDNHPVMKDLTVASIFCAMVTPQNSIPAGFVPKEVSSSNR